MDFNQQIEEAKQKLLSLGFTQEKYNELMDLAAEEMMDEALTELQERDLQVLETLEKDLIGEPKTMEEANQNIHLIFNAAYGEQAEQMKQKLLLEYLNSVITETATTKDLLTRYQAGDPTAVAAIESNKNNPEVQEFVQYMEKTHGEEDQESVNQNTTIQQSTFPSPEVTTE